MKIKELLTELSDWMHSDGDLEVRVRIPGEDEPVTLTGVTQAMVPVTPYLVLEPEELLSEDDRTRIAEQITGLRNRLERDTIRRNARAGSIGG